VHRDDIEQRDLLTVIDYNGTLKSYQFIIDLKSVVLMIEHVVFEHCRKFKIIKITSQLRSFCIR
jgi:hypothetical protein